jgi:AbrB family looped-hinge helix DNA binding protein
MAATSRVGERGQITLPKALRERLGLRKGTVVEITQKGNQLCVQKGPEEESPFRKYMGILKGMGDVDAYIEEMRGR